MTLFDAAQALWRDNKPKEALAEAWAAHRANRSAPEKTLIAQILREEPEFLTTEHVGDFLSLLTDQTIDPSALSPAGWHHILRDTELLQSNAPFDVLAARLERSALALTLLREDIVAQHAAEASLTKVRRWLLLEQHWSDYPHLANALQAQAALNGGAWPFSDDERALLSRKTDFALAYLPPHPGARESQYLDPVTRAVAQQYEAWPYPTWTRVTGGKSTTLAERVAVMDPEGPRTISTPAQILLAGCGSGWQAALAALRMPQDHFSAIDVSEASLVIAKQRCGELGLHNIAFRQLDLHEIAKLDRTFDAIFCTGVLHHLPDPEAGWAKLAGVLKPGGVMHVMVYSRLARMHIAALRRALGDLVNRAVDDDLLREVRRRIMVLPPAVIPNGRDFYSLAGTHDLLLHRHEDAFDLDRIRRGLETLGLRLIRFDFRMRRDRNRYRQENPHDPLQRDFAAWNRAERANLGLFAGMYSFWCRKP